MKNNPSVMATAAAAWTINQNSSLIDRYSELNPPQFQDVRRTLHVTLQEYHDRPPRCRNVRVRSASVRYTCTLSRYSDGRIAELFLSNHKSASAADVGARDAAIAFSFAIQHHDSETIRLALCRDSHRRPSGPLGAALDLLAEGERWP